MVINVQAAEKPITLRYADTAVPGQPDAVGNMWFADVVKELTDGKVIVQYYHSGQLGSDKAITRDTIAGTIDMAKCASANFAEFSKAMYFATLPGVWDSVEHIRLVFQDPQIRNMLQNWMK